MNGDQEFFLIVMVMAGCLGVLLAVTLGPIGRALSRRISGKGEEDSQLRAVVDDLQDRVEQLADLRADLGEVHERLDFAERLLTRGDAHQRPVGTTPDERRR